MLFLGGQLGSGPGTDFYLSWGDSISNLVMQNEDDFRLLRLIERIPEISQREVASKSDLSLGKVNYCLKLLAEKGWVKMKRFCPSTRLDIPIL